MCQLSQRKNLYKNAVPAGVIGNTPDSGSGDFEVRILGGERIIRMEEIILKKILHKINDFIEKNAITSLEDLRKIHCNCSECDCNK
jgi:hypothetical protein